MTDTLRQLIATWRERAANRAGTFTPELGSIVAMRECADELEALLAAGGSVAPKDFEALGECYRKLTDEAPE